jgi:hypothetical protein
VSEKDDNNNALGRLADAIVAHTEGNLFWIGEILLDALERETGYSRAKSVPACQIKLNPS